jgi:hypothetical protein
MSSPTATDEPVVNTHIERPIRPDHSPGYGTYAIGNPLEIVRTACALPSADKCMTMVATTTSANGSTGNPTSRLSLTHRA